MTPKTFRLEIVTPEKVASREEAEFLAAPAYEGEVGILPGHAPMLALLVPGEIRYRLGEREKRLAVSGGFLEVHRDRVQVFAETAEMAEQIDAERARQAAERAKAELVQARRTADEAALLEAQAALRRALARLRVAMGLRRAGRQI